ncbi:glycosyltransferase [Bacteroides caccae]|nr:glycosyltransferase [Bacteroides caccae]
MKINCVIVTYNRLSLLKECISALKNQTYKINKIYIINNNSTDGTSDYLQELIADSQFVIINLPQNIGGAGGIFRGNKKSSVRWL